MAHQYLSWQVIAPTASHIARFTSNPEELDDLLQDVWLRALVAWPQYRGTGSVEGWLLRVTRTVHIERYRVTEATRRAWKRYAPMLAADFAGRVRETETLERALEDQAVSDWATDVLVALPPRQRAVVTLRIMLECPTTEVATLLGIAPGTVKVTLHHATTKLRCVGRVADAPQQM